MNQQTLKTCEYCEEEILPDEDFYLLDVEIRQEDCRVIHTVIHTKCYPDLKEKLISEGNFLGEIAEFMKEN